MAELEESDLPLDWDVRRGAEGACGYSSLPDKKDRTIPHRRARRIRSPRGTSPTWRAAAPRRRPSLLGEIVGWFDFVAIQEVNDDLTGLRAVQALCPKKYRVLFNDAGGNRERSRFLFDSTSSSRSRRWASYGRAVDSGTCGSPTSGRASPASTATVHRHLRGAGAATRGRERPPVLRRREARRAWTVACSRPTAVARWAAAPRLEYAREDVVALGDFNLRSAARDRCTTRSCARARPARARARVGDERARRRRLRPDGHLPRPHQEAIEQVGIFDFDGAVFRDLGGTRRRRRDALVRVGGGTTVSDHGRVDAARSDADVWRACDVAPCVTFSPFIPAGRGHPAARAGDDAG